MITFNIIILNPYRVTKKYDNARHFDIVFQKSLYSEVNCSTFLIEFGISLSIDLQLFIVYAVI